LKLVGYCSVKDFEVKFELLPLEFEGVEYVRFVPVVHETLGVLLRMRAPLSRIDCLARQLRHV